MYDIHLFKNLCISSDSINDIRMCTCTNNKQFSVDDSRTFAPNGSVVICNQ